MLRISLLISAVLAAMLIGSLFALTGASAPSPVEVAVMETPTGETQSTAITTTSIPANTAVEIQLTAITTTPIPTRTAFVPTNTIIPTQSNSLEQFIRTYYQAINSRNYEYTWSLLSDAFRENAHSPQNGGYQRYVDFWDTVDRVEVLETRILEQRSQSATVFVVANYHYQNGVTATGEQNNYFIYDPRRNTWLFDVSR